MAVFRRWFAAPIFAIFLGCAVSPEAASLRNGVAIADPEFLLLETASVENRLQTALRFQAPTGPFTFGDEVLLELVLDNPWLESLEILAAEEGDLLDLVLDVTEWMPTGEKEIVGRKLLQRLLDPLSLAAREQWQQTLPLQIPASSHAAVLEIKLQVRFHPSGVQIGERSLPVRRLDSRVLRLVAFPKGWQKMKADPLAALRKAVVLPQAAADRHVLVASALMPRHLQGAALQVLIRGLDEPPNRERARSIQAALEWLTGFSFQGRSAWQDWWRQRQNRPS